MQILRNSIIGILAVIGLFLAVSGWSPNALAYKAISDNRNRVRVDVKPVQLAPGGSVKFEVRMNTHSVGLSQDLLTVCTLTDDQGNEYRPTNWDGSPPGGHHRTGVLEFPDLGQSALYCVTEVHTQDDLDRLVDSLAEFLAEVKGDRS